MLARLVERADVLMENFRVGVLDRLGFPVSRLHELNPGLVVLSITGFGHDGPEATRAGYDQIAQGEGGLMSITGTEQPTKVGVPIADLIAGMNGAYGVVAALHERTRTGLGRVVRTSLLAGMVGVHAFQGTRWTVAGEVPGLAGDHHPSIAPYGMFATGDRADPDRVRVGGAVAGLCGGVRLGPRRAAASRPTRERVAHRDALIERDRVAVRGPAGRALARSCWRRPGCRPARCASIDDVYAWEQTLLAGPAARRSTTRPSARSSCPARRSASTTTRTPAAGPSTSLPRPSASTTTRSASGSAPDR